MELVKRRKQLTEPEAAYFGLQLLDATRYLHANNIIHRDLKLGNLFLTGNLEMRVGDFGLATQLAFREERKRTVCGTPNYIAPEILDGRDGHSFEVDTWAFGVILYTMIIGKPPFETADVKSTYKRIRENSYSFPPEIPISAEARDLIVRILQPLPASRPSLDAIAQHPFFTGPRMMVPLALPQESLTTVPNFAPDRRPHPARQPHCSSSRRRHRRDAGCRVLFLLVVYAFLVVLLYLLLLLLLPRRRRAAARCACSAARRGRARQGE